MARPQHIDRPVTLHITLPATTRAKLDLFLFSEVEGRVPHGAYAAFLRDRIEEYLGNARLDLGLYGFPAGYWTQGPKEMIELLKVRLEGVQRHGD